jgi:LmbE family N-acetylglucosaminyl deacetylase
LLAATGADWFPGVTLSESGVRSDELMATTHKVADSTLILSPHCDDAPLSLGAALVTRELGSRTRVSVVFSRSGFTKDYPGNGPEIQITALRNNEELEAATIAGYEVEFWGFAEPTIRRAFAQPSGILDRDSLPRDDESWEPVSQAIETAVCHHRGLIIAPLGCGKNIDHMIVREAFLTVCVKYPGLRVGFYEDLPYSNRLSDEQILAEIPVLRCRQFHPHFVVKGLEQKLALVAVYRSQPTHKFIAAVKSYWERRGGERIWIASDAT